MEEIKGKISKVYFTGGATSAILVEQDNRMVRAFGEIRSPLVGKDIRMIGEYKTDPKYGRQFTVIESHISEEMTESGIISYLSSGFIKGVGETIARRIVNKFGKKTINIIEEEPEKLTKVSGISNKKMNDICEAHKMHKVYIDLIEYFNGSATDFQIRTIYEKYEDKSLEKLKENPYILIDDIEGFGFKKADALAKKSGIKEDDSRRIKASIKYVLTAISMMGHCFATVENLIQAALNELNSSSIDSDAVKTAIKERTREGYIVNDHGRIYLKKLYQAEKNTARIIAEMAKKINYDIDASKIDILIKKFEKENSIELEAKQIVAVKTAVTNKLTVITGGPGTGKTTIIKAILYVLKNGSKSGKYIPVRLTAPTGKASKRMTEAVENIERATTIHKLLIEKNIEMNGFLVVDETSMVDIELASRMLEIAYETNNNIILIGDKFQLPSIGPGNFFRDLIDEPAIETVTLDLCYRQTGNIAYNAKMINEGKGAKSWKLNGDSYKYLIRETDDIQKTVIDEYLKLLKKYSVKDVCCIVPTRQAPKVNDTKKRTCSDTLNELIRERINPQKINAPRLNGCKFRVGDRVMNTVNKYEKGVFNGDCGTIIDIDTEDNSVWIEFDSGDIISYLPLETSDLKLAYALTVHKSQGSEYKAVVMAQAKEHYILLQRNLLYTGITRASEKVVLVADKNSVNIALNKNDAITRATQLKQRIESINSSK